MASLPEDRDTQERRILQVQQIPEQILRARCEPRREGVHGNQLFLFTTEKVDTCRCESVQKDKPISDRPKRKRHGRWRLPRSLKRQGTVFDLAQHKKQCSC